MASYFYTCSGAEFVIPFFSGSHSLAFKSSLKSNHLLFIQNEDWNQNVVLVKTLSFWTRFTWWLFDDDLRARARGKRKHKFRASVVTGKTMKERDEKKIPAIQDVFDLCPQWGEIFSIVVFLFLSFTYIFNIYSNTA